MKLKILIPTLFLSLLFFNSCKKESIVTWNPKSIDTAPQISIDRFSNDAGNLMKRSDNVDLPNANEAINFDEDPFITQSFGPNGNVVKYYNFDIQPLPPIPVYMLVNDSGENIKDQLSIFDVIPGESTYNDFWQIYTVQVPNDYIANAITSYQGILNHKLSIVKTNDIVNCPIVPKGSTAQLRLYNQENKLYQAWCRDSIVYYFSFLEKILNTNNVGLTPISDIYVSFNKNPDTEDPTSGPPSGFVYEPGTYQTHNVIETQPEDDNYSALWNVQIYDNLQFNEVHNLETAKNATIVVSNAAYVNCPVVYIE